MRIRHKPHARPTLEACPFFVSDPIALRTGWHGIFNQKRPLHLELGCGKGEFIAALAAMNPEINFLAVDIKDEMLLLAKQAIDEKRKKGEAAADNVRLTSFDIERICEVLAPEDAVQRIYINFPNPWPKLRHRKHRLVHERQIERYLTFLGDNGEVYFRTDDAQLFEDGMEALVSCGFTISFCTRDLLGSSMADYPSSEHQRMFVAGGCRICMCKASRHMGV